MTSRKSLNHYIPTGNTVNYSLLKMNLCSVEMPSSPLHKKGKRSLVLCTNHTKAIPKKNSCLPMVVSSGLVYMCTTVYKAIEEAVKQCETCMQFQAQNAATPLTPKPTPSHPWQICASDIFTLDGVDYLILADLYSKLILVCNHPAGQSKSAKIIDILEEWFCDHGTTKVLCTDNGPQYASAAFKDCSIEWGFTHENSSPHYPQSHGFAESCVKIVKHTLQHTKYSGTNPRIALQHLKATQLMPNFPHPLRCCTTARYIPPYHLGSTILNQQPYRFKSTLRIKPSMPSPVLISAPSNLHHSMVVSQLPYLTP